MGFGPRPVSTGDVTQIDLARGQKSGLIEAERVLKGVRGIAFVRFTSADVVRHPLVQKIIDAYDRDFRKKLATGTLLAIDNQVDSTTGTVRLKAVFKNEDNMLFPNQFVNARLLVDVKRDAVIVPAAAVQRGPNGTFVYVVTAGEKDQIVKQRDVVSGPTEGDQTAIESGLSPGDVVVTDGVDKLTDGAGVAPHP